MCVRLAESRIDGFGQVWKAEDEPPEDSTANEGRYRANYMDTMLIDSDALGSKQLL